MTLWKKLKTRDWCSIFGHKPTVELRDAVNMKGCARCGVLCKVDIQKPCSYQMPPQNFPEKARD